MTMTICTLHTVIVQIEMKKKIALKNVAAKKRKFSFACHKNGWRQNYILVHRALVDTLDFVKAAVLIHIMYCQNVLIINREGQKCF